VFINGGTWQHDCVEPHVLYRGDCSLWGLVWSMSCTPMSSHIVIFYWVCWHPLDMVHYHYVLNKEVSQSFHHCTFFEVVHESKAVVAGRKNTMWVQNEQKKFTSKTHIEKFRLMKYWGICCLLKKNHPILLQKIVGHISQVKWSRKWNVGIY